MLPSNHLKSKFLWKKLCTLYRLKNQSKSVHVTFANQLTIDSTAALAFKTGSTYRRHPGKLQPKVVKLPESLQSNVTGIFKERRIRNLDSQVSALTNYLLSRKRPTEDSEVRAAAQYFTRQLGSTDEDELDSDAQKKLQDKVKSKLRNRLYHWKPISFDENVSFVYLAARMAPNYAIIYRVLHELQRIMPSYQPSSVLDFGSGLGSSIWATNAIFPEAVKEYYCVDISQAMHNLAGKLLLKPDCKGEDPADFWIRGVYQRFFLPVSPQVTYDVTISNNSLLEIHSHEERLNIVNILWKKTNDFLILIENGSLEGYVTLMEARNMILAKGDSDSELREEWKDGHLGHVFAPCSHDVICPRLTRDKMIPCNFEQKYEPLQVPNLKRKVTQVENYSYLVMRKGKRQEGTVWPRVISPVLLRSRHTICRLCHEDGQLKELIITKGKHERDLYKCARYTQWGDLLPVSGIDENTNNRETKTRGRIEERQDNAKDEEREVGEGKNEHLQR
ncbi:ribosome assembly protein METTL17, mitochondrial-like [Apostichopus japonicus]|uniref:ribosome assembly protein METTL17, mitochondrial-like n=1 Tax=Stichopus japonicus TaxID=307972 RepID=UPI003AB152E5